MSPSSVFKGCRKGEPYTDDSHPVINLWPLCRELEDKIIKKSHHFVKNRPSQINPLSGDQVV